MKKLTGCCFIIFLMIISSVAFAASEASSKSYSSASRLGRFQSYKPNWGVEARFSGTGMAPAISIPGTDEKSHPMSMGFGVDYQPKISADIGVLGVGATFDFFTKRRTLSPLSELVFAWSGGAQLTYQAAFELDQFFVPFVRLGFSSYQYRFADGESGFLLPFAPGLGMLLSLNALDMEKGFRVFSDNGLARSYLAFEYKRFFGNNEVVSINGDAFSVGLRFEY